MDARSLIPESGGLSNPVPGPGYRRFSQELSGAWAKGPFVPQLLTAPCR